MPLAYYEDHLTRRIHGIHPYHFLHNVLQNDLPHHPHNGGNPINFVRVITFAVVYSELLFLIHANVPKDLRLKNGYSYQMLHRPMLLKTNNRFYPIRLQSVAYRLSVIVSQIKIGVRHVKQHQ